MTKDLTTAFAMEMARYFPNDLPKTVGVAVSGGGDSMALACLMAAWAAPLGVAVKAVIVDHGLREGSAAEAVDAGKTCNGLGLSHDILNWGAWDGTGNLQDTARHARRALISTWAQHNDVATVALGHTQDDQAETVLMRLARGSGVDGLAGMARQTNYDDITFIRPLLPQTRRALRGYLHGLNIQWTDDPSNDDRRFDRIKARHALAHLQDLGLTAEGLTVTANRMASTRRYLEGETQRAAQALVTISVTGDVIIKRADFAALPFEMQHRLLAHALKWVASSPYRPRQSALVDVLGAIAAGKARTLAGCQIIVAKNDSIRVFREYQALKDHSCAASEIWDSRWYATGPDTASTYRIAPLGEAGLSQCPEWRGANHPRASLLSSPAIWYNHDVMATTFTKSAGHWRICLKKGPEQFYLGIITH